MSFADRRVHRGAWFNICRAFLWFGAVTALGSAACLAQQPRSFWTVQLSQPLPPPLPPQTSESQPTESLPPPTPSTTRQAPPLPPDCLPAPVDPALSELTADIAPLANAQAATQDRYPADCARSIFVQEQFVPIDFAYGSCEPSLCELLQLGWFCHRPLYFEESLLERHGVCDCCCQPLSSACHFYGGVLLLPFKMTRHCLCSCVSSANPCD